MVSIIKAAVVAIASIALLGCMGPSLLMNVKTRSDPEVNLNGIRRFALVPVNKTQNDPLLEKELLALVRKQLQAKGLVFDPENPELLVSLAGYVGPFQQYVPAFSGVLPVVTSHMTTDYVPVSRGAYTRTQFYRVIHVIASRPIGPGKVEVVWSGTVESEGSSSDLMNLAPYLLGELLDEYPARTRKPAARSVVMDR